MDQAFKALLDTKELWFPALSRLLAQLSAIRPGNKIERSIKQRLGWLKENKSEQAFSEAFESGVQKYSTERGSKPAARSAARILAKSVSDPNSMLSAAAVMEQIIADRADEAIVSRVASEEAVEFEDTVVPQEAIAQEMSILISDYLHPAFRAHPYFTEQIASSEIKNILTEVLNAVSQQPQIDLAELHYDYCSKLGEKYDVIPMQGISPKVQNRTIGIRMEDIFIPLKAMQESETFANLPVFGQVYYSDVRGPDLTGFAAIGNTPDQQIFLDSTLYSSSYIIGGSATLNAVVSNWATNISKGPEHTSVDIKTLLQSGRIVVRGDPGAGKSTLMRYVTWALARTRTELIGQDLVGRVPILIRSIEFGEALDQGRVDSLDEYLAEHNRRFAPIIKQAIASGNALIMIDGLDEVSQLQLRMRVKERVDDFIADPIFSQNRLIITSRIVGYERSGLTGNFKHFTISELDDDQIEQFVVSWYRGMLTEVPGETSHESESAQLLEAINGNDSIRRMARNPLLLTIIALIKWQGRALPDQRVLLYDAAAQTLIKSWPLTQRRVEFDELFIREWLAPVALHILADRTGDLIDEYSLMTELTSVMRRLRSMTDLQAKTNSQELLDSLSEHSGFLLPKGTDADGHTLYGFFHQTFAEFLAAYNLAGRWEDEDLDLAAYAHDPYWREVFLLMAGHLGTQRRAKAGKFINAVRELRSSPYEDLIHRDLLVACQILADGTPAGPASLIESLLAQLLSEWRSTHIPSLQTDIANIFRQLGKTEYAQVLARLAVEQNLPYEEIFTLARQLGPATLSVQLKVAMQDADPEIRLSAMELLLDIHKIPVIEAALRVVNNAKPMVARRALRLLMKTDNHRAIAAVVDCLKSRPLVFLETGMIRETINPQMADAISEYISTDDQDLSITAAMLLIAANDKRGVEGLKRLASSTDPRVVIPALAAAGALDELPAETLMELVHNGDKNFRSVILMVLAQSDLPPNIGSMIELDENGDPAVQNYLVDILAKQEDPRGVAILRKRLQSEDNQLRLDAALSLSSIGDAEGIAALNTYLDDPDPRNRLLAIRVLRRYGKIHLLEHLEPLIRSENVGVRLEAIETLANVRGTKVVKLLVPLLDDPRFGVRRAAARILMSRDEPLAVSAMKSHLQEFMERHEDPETRNEFGELANCGYEFLKSHLTPKGEIRSDQ